MKAKTSEKEFWEKGEYITESGCLIWMLGESYGYGHVKFGGKQFFAHRLAWELTFGDIPKGIEVLHHCDIPLCFNPKHLFLGTQADNLHDAQLKGRRPLTSYGVPSKVNGNSNPEYLRRWRRG